MAGLKIDKSFSQQESTRGIYITNQFQKKLCKSLLYHNLDFQAFKQKRDNMSKCKYLFDFSWLERTISYQPTAEPS